MAFVIQRNGRKMKDAQLKVQDDLADLGAMTSEALMGTRVIRAFAAEEKVESTYSNLVERSYRSQVVAIKRLSSLRPLVELIGAFALAAVLYICGWMSYAGIIQLGQIAALIYALDRINQGFKSIGSVTNTYSMVEAASLRIHTEVLDVPEPHDSDSGETLAHPVGHIEFRNVSFAYPDGTEALRNVSFTIEPGTSLALVGPSGAGKSTIADLVLRFYDPSEGQILFDGRDIRTLRLSWLRNQIGVVPQQTFLFAGSVADNLRLGKEDATDEELREAAIAAHADEFISTMNVGYSSELGESGIRLSGGQRQRIAIARALVRKPALLLLDEATSALDPTSEKIVTEALDEIMRTRTTLFIAHRLTTAARADRILVLRRGEVVELGSHKDLIDRGGVYAGLFAAFSGGVLD
jgi:ABC-type multidrug transport system fused ATPase/permease subunit